MIGVAGARESATFRPFFYSDEQGRILAWPELTARALHIDEQAAIGRRCWEVLGGSGASKWAECAVCQRRATVRRAPLGMYGARSSCDVLEAGGAQRGLLAWLPLSHVQPGDRGSALIESLVVRGVLAAHLGSIRDALQTLRSICAADDCELFVLDASGRSVELVDCEGVDRDKFMEITHMPLGEGYPGKVTLQRRPICTHHFERDTDFIRAGARNCGLHSFIGVPLVHQDRPLGYLGMGWRDASVPIEWCLRIIEESAQIIGEVLVVHGLKERAALGCIAPELSIRCLGTLEVIRNDRMSGHVAFRRRHARRLLGHLILKRGGALHRDWLIEALWPGAEHRAALNRLHGVVNVLRSAVETGRIRRRSAFIEFDGEHYRLNPDGACAIDLYAFDDALAAAGSARRRGDEPGCLAWLETAIDMYRGDLFGDDDGGGEVFEAHRIRVRHAYLDAVRAVARLRVARGDIGQALRILSDALVFEPAALDLHEMLIEELVRAGRLLEAREQFERCRVASWQHLDMAPPARLAQLLAQPQIC